MSVRVQHYLFGNKKRVKNMTDENTRHVQSMLARMTDVLQEHILEFGPKHRERFKISLHYVSISGKCNKCDVFSCNECIKSV